MEKKTYRIVVVGPTGSGKSQFCNFVKKDLTNSFYKVDDSLNHVLKKYYPVNLKEIKLI